MCVCHLIYYRNDHGKCDCLVTLENGQEIVVFEETHGSIGNLEMWGSNAPNKSFEKSVYQRLNFVEFTNLQHLKKFT